MVDMTTGYQMAHEGAVVVDRSALGMLKFTGETRLDLISRMSTQKVLGLKGGEGAGTVFTTDIGRIIDRLLLYTSSDTVYALTGENNSDTIARYLMRFVFFQDDFHIEDVSAETQIFGVYGKQAQTLLANVGFPEVELPLHHWRQAEIDGVTLYLHKTDPIAGDGYFVMCGVDVAEQVLEKLTDAGIGEISAETYHYLRIESGVPAFGAEMTGDYIPLETDLWDDISFNKGCYIGQEIIARMDSRGKLAKKLVRFSAESPIEAGTEIMANGKKAGSITSAADGTNGAFALGYVRSKPLSAENTHFTAADVTLTPLDLD